MTWFSVGLTYAFVAVMIAGLLGSKYVASHEHHDVTFWELLGYGGLVAVLWFVWLVLWLALVVYGAIRSLNKLPGVAPRWRRHR